MDCKKLAELLFPDINKTPDDYEEEYPLRDLPAGAVVTRLAPSPTGFMIGVRRLEMPASMLSCGSETMLNLRSNF